MKTSMLPNRRTVIGGACDPDASDEEDRKAELRRDPAGTGSAGPVDGSNAKPGPSSGGPGPPVGRGTPTSSVSPTPPASGGAPGPRNGRHHRRGLEAAPANGGFLTISAEPRM